MDDDRRIILAIAVLGNHILPVGGLVKFGFSTWVSCTGKNTECRQRVCTMCNVHAYSTNVMPCSSPARPGGDKLRRRDP